MGVWGGVEEGEGVEEGGGVAVSRVEAPGLSPLSLHVGGVPKDSSGKRPVTPPTLPLSTYCTHTHTEVGGLGGTGRGRRFGDLCHGNRIASPAELPRRGRRRLQECERRRRRRRRCEAEALFGFDFEERCVTWR